MRHQPNQHQAVNGDVLLVLRAVLAVLLQGILLAEIRQEGEDRTHTGRAQGVQEGRTQQLSQTEEWCRALVDIVI